MLIYADFCMGLALCFFNRKTCFKIIIKKEKNCHPFSELSIKLHKTQNAFFQICKKHFLLLFQYNSTVTDFQFYY